MKVSLSDHAKVSLLIRDIDFQRVKHVLIHSKEHSPAAGGRSKARMRLDDGRVLEVIYKYQKSACIVITAYYDDNL